MTADTKQYSMLIDGGLAAGEDKLDVINPATGQAFARCPRASSQDLERAVSAAAQAFTSWKQTTLDHRKGLLRQAGDIILAHADELAAIFTREQGRPLPLALQEVQGAGQWFHATAALDLPVDVTEDTETRRVEVHHVPLGVVCGIVPWNFPVLLAAWKIAPAILAGNTIVLKPSPFTPLCTLRIGELLKDVFPKGVLNILSGGDELGPMMTAHKGFAKITFTGSTATGKRVMEAASRDLKRVTLELGGNDAAIVLPDVDPAKVSEQLFMGAFFNSAQVCVATKRLYVHDDIYDQVRDHLVKLIENAPLGDGSEQGVLFGPVQNRPQFDRVNALIDEARDQGLTLYQGHVPATGDGYFIPLTLVDNPPEDSRVVREEAFGPVLPLLRFSTVDEVVRRANDTEYGLAGAVWSADLTLAASIAARLDTGTVWINQNLQSTPLTPLAGHKQSGIGVENGVYGLMEFTQPKAVYIPKDTSSVV